MKKKPTVEKYWAIIIGHRPYFMIRRSDNTPWLFLKREEAEFWMKGYDGNAKIARVKISTM